MQVPEGTYELTVANNGWGGSTQVTITRGQTTTVDLDKIKGKGPKTGKALSREDILNEVWGRDYFGELKIVDVNIRRLRIKIEDDPTMPAYITTVWGYGYKWGL